MATRSRRSCLTVPASSVKMLTKAAGLPADEVVVDLEDGVAPADKDAARSRLGEAAARGTLAVRINAVGTAWWRDDLTAVDEQRWVTLGRDTRGRILVVAYTGRGDRIRIFSARRATASERRQYLEEDP